MRDHGLQGLCIVRQDAIQPSQDVTRGSRHALPGRGVGNQQCYAGFGGERQIGSSTHQCDDRRAREALEVNGNKRVDAHRRGAIHGNGGKHLARMGGVKIETSDFADTDTVEQDGGALEQS